MKYKILMIMFIMIVLVFSLGITYSIFHSNTIMSSNNQNIAKFVFNAEKSDEINLPLANLNPGDNLEYKFSVSNIEEEILSDVSIEYQLKIKTYHFIPLVIELYEIVDENEEYILTCDESYTRNENNELICNVPIQEMGCSNQYLDNFKLKISFPDEYKDAVYSNLVDYINIEIKSWQKIED